MSVASNSSGSFQRGTNVPAPANFTACFWARWDTASLSGNYFQSLFGLDGSGYLQLGSNGGSDPELHLYAGTGSSNTTIHNPGDAWFFYALVGSATNVCTVYYRAATANTLTSVACGGGATGATGLYFLQDSNGSGQRADRAQGLAFKVWDAQLTVAELLAESYFIQPQRRANINTFVPFYGAGGTDESGLGRNLTVNGTPIATGATPPIKSRRSAAKVFLPAAVTSITGTLAATIAPITSSAAGAVAVAGAASPTVPAVTSSAAGAVAVAGSGSPTVDAITPSAAGAVAVAGSLASTVDNLTVSAAGTVADTEIEGALASTIDPITASAAGVVPVAGSLAQPIGDIALSAAGVVPVAGSLAATVDNLSASAAGTVAIAGAGTPTLDPVTSAGTGAVAVTGSGSPAIGDVTLSAVGGSGTFGELAETIEPITAAAVGAVAVAGTLGSTLDPVSASATGTVAIQGAGAAELGAVTLGAAGAVPVVGSGSPTIEPITLSAAGGSPLLGALAATIDPITLSATATSGDALLGQLAQTIAPITVSAAGNVSSYAEEYDGEIIEVVLADMPRQRVVIADAQRVEVVLADMPMQTVRLPYSIRRTYGELAETIGDVTASGTGVLGPVPGLVWETTFNSSQNNRGIDYDSVNQRLIMVCSNGTSRAYYSDDHGETWTAISTIPAQFWVKVAYSPTLDMWLACSLNSGAPSERVSISTDGGATWASPGNPGVNPNFSDVRWNAQLGKFVIIGNDEVCLYDGTSFELYAMPVGGWNTSAFNGSRLVSLANSGTNRAAYSDDGGQAWTSTPAPSDSRVWVSSDYSPTLERFSAVSSGGATGETNRAGYSSDGITWIMGAVPSGIGVAQIKWVPALGLFVGVCSSSADGSTRVVRSSDGITYVNDGASIDAAIWQDIVYMPDANRFCAVAVTGEIAVSPLGTISIGSADITVDPITSTGVGYSGSGLNWTIQSSAADLNWRGLAYSPTLDRYVAVASSGSGNQVMTSDDGGVTWTSQTTPAATTNWRRVVWVESLGLFVACAVNGTDRIMTSPDGETWTLRVNPTGGNSIAWSESLGLLCAVQSGANNITTSPDGINWTARNTPNAANRTGIVWSAALSLFVCVGNTGTAAERVLTSPDGINWTARTAASDAAWLGIDTDENGFLVAVAGNPTTGNRVMTSPDGINWTLRASADDSSNWQNVYYASDLGTWHAVAQTGTTQCQISSDGINWSSVPVPASLQWYQIGGHASRLVALAASGTGNRVMTSGPP